MKKYLTVVFVLLFAVLSLQAEKQVVLSLNFSTPVQFETWRNTNSKLKTYMLDSRINDVTFLNFDFNLNVMTVHDGGFSFLAGTGKGAVISLSDEKCFKSKKGFDSNFKVGWGFAPVHDSNNILVFHGFLYFNYKLLGGNFTADFGDDEIVDLDYDAGYLTFGTGFDVVFVHHFTNHFGLLAGLDIYMPTSGTFDISLNSDFRNYYDDDFHFSMRRKLGITPRIGICWVTGND